MNIPMTLGRCRISAKLSLYFNFNFNQNWLSVNFILSNTHPPSAQLSLGLVLSSNYNINFNFIENSKEANREPGTAFILISYK